MRTNPALPPPLTSTSTSSRPSDCVTCCAISSIFTAIASRMAAAIAGANKKVGFRPLDWLDNSIHSVPCLSELRKGESCLIQDEPGGGAGFSYKMSLGSDRACWDLTISVETSERLSLEQIQVFLDGSGELGFKGQNREEVYGWVDQTLRQQRYEGLLRSERGLVRRYVEKMTGLSRAQTTRLITVYVRGDEVKPQPYQRRRFAQRYTREDSGCGRGTRDPERAGDEEAAPEGLLQLPRNAIPELGADLGGAVVPTAEIGRASRAAHQVPGDAADTGVDRRAEKAGAAWAPWILAHRHGASGRPGRGQGGVPHQRGGRGDAMGSGGVGGADQRSLSATDAEGHAGAVSVPHSGLPLRQRQRVH